MRRGVVLRGRVKGFGWMMICRRDLVEVGLGVGAWWTIWRGWLGGEGWFGFRGFACGSRGRRWAERATSKGRFLEVLLSPRKDWRRLSSWSQSLRAAVSAAWTEDPELGLGLPAVGGEKELTAMRDF